MAKRQSGAVEAARVFTPRELVDFLNNAVLSSRQLRGQQIGEGRLRSLRAYAQAFLHPLNEAIEKELLRPNEAIHLLTCMALFLFSSHMTQAAAKAPLEGEARELLLGQIPEEWQARHLGEFKKIFTLDEDSDPTIQ